MDPSEYRKKYIEQLDRAAERQRKPARPFYDKSLSADERRAALPKVVTNADEVTRAIGIVGDRDEDAQLRASVLLRISQEVGKRHELIDLVIGLMSNPAEPEVVRSAALHVLEQSSIRTALFAPKRADFLAALRGLIDSAPRLRERALEILALEKDEYVQRRLLAGLRNAAEALISPHKAIQFLGYDIHAEHYPILRQMVLNPPSQEAKQEAVRLLATDSGSKDLLIRLLQDKDETKEVRQLSAAALQSLAPQEFLNHARNIVLDNKEYDDLRALSLNALTHFADQKVLNADTELTKAVQQLETKAVSNDVKKSVSGLLSRLKKFEKK